MLRTNRFLTRRKNLQGAGTPPALRPMRATLAAQAVAMAAVILVLALLIVGVGYFIG